MVGSFRAELVKIRRPATAYGALAMMAFAALATVLTFVAAKTGPARVSVKDPGGNIVTTLSQLGSAAGISRGYNVASGLIGLVVFVLFVTAITGEYAQGTMRVMLTREPRRARYLTGRLAALLLLVAVVLLAALVASIGAALISAQVRGVPTGQWFTSAGFGHVAGDYFNSVVTATCFGALGTALGLAVRSTPLALGIGLAWLLPIEHILQTSWSAAPQWLPGLLSDAVAVGGSVGVSYLHAVVAAVGYAFVAAVLGGAVFMRRDAST